MSENKISENSLIKKAQSGEARFYLQFGGQGTPWLPELLRYYQNPDFKTFFDTVFRALEEEQPRVEGTVGLPRGLDLQAWLKDKESIPSEEYLSYAAVSLPLIQVTQFAHYENLRVQNISHQDLISWSLGAAGHSQGIIAAAFTALALEGEAYYEALAQFIKYQLYLGVSAQKAHPYLSAAPEELAESQSLGAKKPSPMAAVLGGEHSTMEKLVEEVNTELPAEAKIYISLYNSPTNRILSSYRSSLIAFHKKYRKQIDEKQFKFVYLNTSCPFHCPLLKDMRPIIEREIQHTAFRCNSKDLKLPVYSFSDQGNYQDIKGDLGIRMFEDLMLNTLHWDKAMHAVTIDKKISHVLDFGPGKTSQRLSTDTLKGLGCEKSVIALAKGLQEILG